MVDLDGKREEFKALMLATNEYCLANFQLHEAGGKYYDWCLQAKWEGYILGASSAESERDALKAELESARKQEEKNKFFVYDWMKGAEFFSSEEEAMQSFDERIELQKTTPGGDVAGVCWGLVKRGYPVSFRDGILSRLGGGGL